MFSRSYNRSSVSTPKQAGRFAQCDKCQWSKDGCIWIRREDSGRSYVLCPNCREAWKAYGVAMVNVDTDYQAVEL